MIASASRGSRPPYDRWLRGTSGLAELRVDSLGRPTAPLTLTRAPTRRRSVRLTLDVGLQRSAERGSSLWDRDGARDRRRGRRTEARSSRSTRTPATSSRWRRTRRSARNVFAGRVDPEAGGAAPRREGGEARELPRAEPSDRGHLPAGLDLQAGDGAGGAPGAPRRPRTRRCRALAPTPCRASPVRARRSVTGTRS